MAAVTVLRAPHLPFAIPAGIGSIGWLAVIQRCGDDWLHEVKYDGHRIRHSVRRAKRAATHRPIRVQSHTVPARAISRSAVSSGASSCSTAEIAVPDERGCHPDILGRILRVDRDFVRYYAAPSGTSGRGSFWSGFRTEYPRQKRTRSMPTFWRSSKASAPPALQNPGAVSKWPRLAVRS